MSFRRGALLRHRAGIALGAAMLAATVPVFRAGAARRPLLHREGALQAGARISVILPTLNEEGRIGPCLDALAACGPRVTEILLVDCASSDRTVERAHAHPIAGRLAIHVVRPPEEWNGKAWALLRGAELAENARVLCVDADVRIGSPAPEELADALDRHRLSLASAALDQAAPGLLHNAVHASMLASLVARTGVPGSIRATPSEAFANGQLFATTRDLLATGMRVAARSRCEDVSLARWLAATGRRVGYVRWPSLGVVEMYSGPSDALRRWPRSLQLSDKATSSTLGLLGWLALALAPLAAVAGVARGAALIAVAARAGLAAGVGAAYVRPNLGVALAPAVDLVTAAALLVSAWTPKQGWRGRDVVYER